MSQVVIVIDVPDHGADALVGNTLLRIAENTAKEIRKQLPLDDHVRVASVWASETPVDVQPATVSDEQFQEWGREAVASLPEAQAPESE